MKIILTFGFFICVSLFTFHLSFSQAPAVLWSRCYGGSSLDHCSAVRQTMDGGYIMTGFTASNDRDVSGNNGIEDFWVVKTDDNGYLLWQKCLGGSMQEESKSIQQTTDGGFIIAGFTNSNDSDLTVSYGGNDAWVVKLDSTGNMQWQKSLGGSNDEGAAYYGGIVAEQTTDGGYIVGTSSNSTDYDVVGNHGDYDYWIVKLSSTGQIQWQKCYGGSGQETLKDIHVTLDGGYIIAGISASTDGDLTGYNDFFTSFFVKTDSIGSIEWRASYFCIDTVSNCNGQMSVSSIIQKPGGDYLAAGTIYYYGNVYFFVTNTLSSTGVVGSYQQYSSLVNPWRNFCNSIQPSADNGFILSGQTDDANDNFLIYKNGTLGSWSYEWDTLSPEYQIAGTTIQCADGGFVIGATTDADLSCSPVYDPWQFRLIKLGGMVPVIEDNIPEKISCTVRGNILTISSSLLLHYNFKMFLFDLAGRKIFQSYLAASSGIGIKEIDISDIAKGIYVVTLEGAGGKKSLKVVRE